MAFDDWYNDCIEPELEFGDSYDTNRLGRALEDAALMEGTDSAADLFIYNQLEEYWL